MAKESRYSKSPKERNSPGLGLGSGTGSKVSRGGGALIRHGVGQMVRLAVIFQWQGSDGSAAVNWRCEMKAGGCVRSNAIVDRIG